MKGKSIFSIISLLIIMSLLSCKKTYVCKDSQGLSIGQVEARNIKKAKDMCPMYSTVELNE